MCENSDSKWCFIPGVIYEYTQTFSDKYQYIGKGTARPNAVKELFKSILDDMKVGYEMYMEISMPQYSTEQVTVPRIHYHGVIVFKTPQQILMYLTKYHHQLAMLGKIQWNEFRPNVWPEYCTKHLELFSLLKCNISTDYIMMGPSEAESSEEDDILELATPVADSPKKPNVIDMLQNP